LEQVMNQKENLQGCNRRGEGFRVQGGEFCRRNTQLKPLREDPSGGTSEPIERRGTEFLQGFGGGKNYQCAKARARKKGKGN